MVNLKKINKCISSCSRSLSTFLLFVLVMYVLFSMKELTALQCFQSLVLKLLPACGLTKENHLQSSSTLQLWYQDQFKKSNKTICRTHCHTLHFLSGASLSPKYWGPWWAHSDEGFVKYYHLFFSLFPISTSSILIYSSNGPRPYKPLCLCHSKWCLIPDYTNLWVRWYFFCLVQE